MSGIRWPTDPSPRGQALLVVPGLLGLLVGLAALYLHYGPSDDAFQAMVASFASYGVLGSLVGLLALGGALVRSGHRGLLAVCAFAAALALALELSWVAPLFVPDRRPVTTPPITLLSLNMLGGHADPDQLTAASAHADLVVLVEYSPAAGKELARRGWDRRYPYTAGVPSTHPFGTAVYSRFPISDATRLGSTDFMEWRVAVDVPTMGRVTLVAAHPCNPFCGYGAWVYQHAVLRASVQPYLPGRLIVAGDLNATADHVPIRQLESDGLRSAADLSGAGWLPTYPANRRLPPLLPLDFVLVSRSLTATSVRTFTVAGTDHRGLIATIAGSRS